MSRAVCKIIKFGNKSRRKIKLKSNIRQKTSDDNQNLTVKQYITFEDLYLQNFSYMPVSSELMTLTYRQ
jgi:hypothetical protein